MVDGSQGIYSIKPNKQGTYWLGGDILVQSEEGEKNMNLLSNIVLMLQCL